MRGVSGTVNDEPVGMVQFSILPTLLLGHSISKCRIAANLRLSSWKTVQTTKKWTRRPFCDTLSLQFRIWRKSPWRRSSCYTAPISICWVPASRKFTSETLDEINHRLRIEAERVGATLTCLQSNGEQELVEAIHQARTDGTQFIIINPAAFTHTSVAIRDALSAVQIPCIEVHISNIYARETFRHHSYISDVAEAVISGLGSFGYDCALAAVLQSLDTHSTQHQGIQMDIRKVKKLIELLEESNIGEIEIKEGENSVHQPSRQPTCGPCDVCGSRARRTGSCSGTGRYAC